MVPDTSPSSHTQGPSYHQASGRGTEGRRFILVGYFELSPGPRDRCGWSSACGVLVAPLVSLSRFSLSPPSLSSFSLGRSRVFVLVVCCSAAARVLSIHCRSPTRPAHEISCTRIFIQPSIHPTARALSLVGWLYCVGVGGLLLTVPTTTRSPSHRHRIATDLQSPPPPPTRPTCVCV